VNTCGTCKHLGEAIEDYIDIGDGQEDLRPTGYFRCNLIKLARKEKKIPPPLAYAQDASDYSATLCIREEFGCIEWAERPVGWKSDDEDDE
jgi:hypothetical protein